MGQIHGADIQNRDYFLHLASYYGHLEIVILLLNRGADLHANNGHF